MSRYYGSHYWYYRIPGTAVRPLPMVELKFAGFGYGNDEAAVRSILREQLGVSKLPRGTKVWPKT